MRELTVLDNGLRIWLETVSGARSVAFGVWVGTGSRDESGEYAGACHFIEHMLFKGTARMDAYRLAREMDRLGGNFNAYTDKEVTCFLARVRPEHVRQGLDLLSEMLLASVFEPSQVEVERRVIFEEMAMYRDNAEDVAQDAFASALWGDHPLARPVLGDEDSVKRVGQEQLLEFYREWFTPDRSVVAVAGRFDEHEVLEYIWEAFGGWQGRSEKTRSTPASHRGVHRILTRPGEQVHVSAGTAGPALGDDWLYAAYVLSEMYGAGPSSRLFQRVRENGGLVYSILSDVVAYSDTGSFGIYLATTPANVQKVLDEILSENVRLLEEGVSPEEIESAREQLISATMLSAEGPVAVASRAAKSLLGLGRVRSLEDVTEGIRAVRQDALLDAAHRLLDTRNWSWAAVGPRAGSWRSALLGLKGG
ncbi:MAG: pitrilysin family protein [Bacillota bacterium]